MTDLSQISYKLDLGVSSCSYIRTKEFNPVIMCCASSIDGLFVDHEPMLAGIGIWLFTIHGEVSVHPAGEEIT